MTEPTPETEPISNTQLLENTITRENPDFESILFSLDAVDVVASTPENATPAELRSAMRTHLDRDELVSIPKEELAITDKLTLILELLEQKGYTTEDIELIAMVASTLSSANLAKQHKLEETERNLRQAAMSFHSLYIKNPR